MATASGGESWHSPTVPLSAEQLADPTGAGETANHSASHTCALAACVRVLRLKTGQIIFSV